MLSQRRATVDRETHETRVRLEINLDGEGLHNIDTGIHFLNHLLGSLALHGMIDLNIQATGDLKVDDHHVIEDVALALGQALSLAVGEKKGLKRFGYAVAPMDDALIMAAVDLSGRFHFESNLEFKRTKIGDLMAEMINHFLKSFAETGRLNLHIVALRGSNDHHKAEGTFKAVGLALASAVEVNPRLKDRPASEKGVL
ncbi:MAG: imidazoleglycerol-phosphate dehydratase HisB [Candidatus Bathyarchaeia archaeon]